MIIVHSFAPSSQNSDVEFPTASGWRVDKHGRLHVFERDGREVGLFADGAWVSAWKTSDDWPGRE